MHAISGAPQALRREAPKSARGSFGRWPGKRLAPSLGLELRDISLADALSGADIASLRRLLVEHKVLVFREQHITPAQHVAFARRFGELEVHAYLDRHPEHPELVTFVHDASTRPRENVFHSDTSFRAAPSMGSVLRCVECPEVGGDTLFVNMADVYAALPDAVKQKLEGLLAVHDAAVTFAARMKTPEERQRMRVEAPPTEHPVVRTHPESGEKILFVNEAFSTHFANYKQVNDGTFNMDHPTQSRDLFAFLLRQARTPEFQVRIRWEPDTVVFWDNRATQHYAIGDYHPHTRSMMRATVVGDRPC